jgi:uncharacterized membrane protein
LELREWNVHARVLSLLSLISLDFLVLSVHEESIGDFIIYFHMLGLFLMDSWLVFGRSNVAAYCVEVLVLAWREPSVAFPSVLTLRSLGHNSRLPVVKLKMNEHWILDML